MEDYLIYFNGIINIVVLGFIIRFVLFIKSAFKEKEDILLKQIAAIREDLQRTEKWAERNHEQLENEKDKLKENYDVVVNKLRSYLRPPDGKPSSPVNNTNITNLRSWINKYLEAAVVAELPIANFITNKELEDLRQCAIKELNIS